MAGQRSAGTLNFYGLFLQASSRPPALLSGERDFAGEFPQTWRRARQNLPCAGKRLRSVQDDSRGDKTFAGLALHPYARRKRHSC